MGLRDTFIITILLSLSLCEGKSIASTVLQGLLSSNPQLAKMLSNKLMSSNVLQHASSQRPYYSTPILNGHTTQLYPVASVNRQTTQVSSVPLSSMPVASVPVASVPISSGSVATISSPTGQYVSPVYQNYQKSQYSQAKVEYPSNQVYQVQAKEVAPKDQFQTPVSYSTVQQTTQTTYPTKPSPFVSPAAMVNPFLPAASPMSALCPPTSSLLPPAIPSLARSQFLRKVPIPPPCL